MIIAILNIIGLTLIGYILWALASGLGLCLFALMLFILIVVAYSQKVE